MNELKAPRRQASLAAQLVAMLKDHIASGGWAVGTRIPSEHELLDQFGVGRSTLREALGALVHLGLLEARVGDGTYVRATSELGAVLERRAAAARRSEVLGLRAVLEKHASSLAAVNRSDDDLARLHELLHQADDAYASRSMELVAETDRQFHHAIVKASGSELLTEVYDYLGNALKAALGGLPWDDDIADGHAALHRELLASLEAKDEAGAARAAADIVRLTRESDQDELPGFPIATDGAR
ncbi:FCD domain-containing protein [Amycolatopsis rhabdoformis]|uniref:FCD domain-containing protein n=1 Tax=Amycolatopsis rhabdoformis TaxID=1448059 RepID=A0ABZ1IHE1_9PSEU|nr:FCD domain-containing protein [Amycolatopsis rhabdoformis]WSE33531.1 FCD domain-containing protein [Amycolatopsis rhabdoformis]